MIATNRPAGPVPRRRLLRIGAVTAGAAATAPMINSPERAAGVPRDDLFTLGVASGDPTANSVVIWTRLAPDPVGDPAGTGGMPDRDVAVEWEVAEDAGMTRPVRAGVATARARFAHSVHVDVRGLRADRVYYYRFRVAGQTSPVGRTRTAARVDARLRELRFAFASCQNYSQGYYTAHRRLAGEEVDFVLFLGDYIYENPGDDDLGRLHLPHGKLVTLSDYRIRHAQYKQDPNLQAAHAAAPWIVTLDNHDVTVGYAGFWSKYGWPAEQVAEYRRNAFQAAWEHLPMRDNRIPDGPYFKLYQRFRYGDLATFNVLDVRQYADAHAGDCAVEDRIEGYCPEMLDPNRTILGRPQREWLLDGLAESDTRWNVLGNPFFFTPHDHDPDPEQRSFNPKWDHYVADRQRILDALVAQGRTDVVIVTGDSHSNCVQDVPPDYRDWAAAPVATEFMGTSLSSGGDRPPRVEYDPDPVNNPQERFRNNGRGYVVCTLNRSEWRSDYRVMDTVEAEESDIRTLSSWVVERTRPGAQRAG